MGNLPNILVNGVQNGAAFINPVRGDMVRTFKTKPQVGHLFNSIRKNMLNKKFTFQKFLSKVTVTIAGIEAQCTGNCDFDWLDSQTPQVTSIDTS